MTQSRYIGLLEGFDPEDEKLYPHRKRTKAERKGSEDYAEEGGFKDEPTRVSIDGFYNPKDKHKILTILEIGTAFIPFVGPLISSGIGLYDAKTYYDEGDKKTAGLIAMFSVIPGIGGLASKLELTKWSAKALGQIGKKISLGKKLKSAELEVISKITQHRKLIQSEMKKIGESATIKSGTQAAKGTLKKQGAAKSIKNVAKSIAGYGAAGVGYSKGYNYVQKDTPKTKSESEGYDWDLVKISFGSNGTKEDNKLLNQSWDKGCRPGNVVPKEFQTKQYQDQYSRESQNIKKLQQLVAQNQKK
jgi:hypothetical protein